ncbi:hypothetical protein [Kitasatospora phosalacinea]|nr:hypothetical protein [Kitasatospora phosalacinea]
MPIQPVWRSVVVAAAALATATAVSTAAPVYAQAATSTTATTATSHVTAWTSDGWGGGTVVSHPAGINCHQSAWDPYTYDENAAPQPDTSGTCDAVFPVGTVVTFTATPDPGSNLNYGPDPASLTVRAGYNATYVVFCPNDGLCSAWY